jgi:MYXO-CTERM domain-containing protein
MGMSNRWATGSRTAQQATLTIAAALAFFASAPCASAADAGALWVEEEFVTPAMCTSSFALTTDLLLVGAPCWETAGRQRQGALLEFRRDHAQNRWSYVSTPVVVSDGQTGSELGAKVLLDGDTAVVGAPARAYFTIPAGQGAAYVFTRTAGGWTETQKLTAPDGHAGDRFGQHAVLSGDTVAISAFHGPMEIGPGRVYVYVRSGGRFAHFQTLEADNPTVYPFFGTTLALEGDTLLVGMADVRGPAPRPPRSVLVFRRASASARFERVQEIIPTDPSTAGSFGYAVALQGDLLLVGAVGAFEEHGAVFDFRRTSTGLVEHAHFIPQQVFQRDGVGSALALDGDMALVGAPNYTTPSDSYSGAVTVWTLSAGEWIQETMFRPSGSFVGFGQDLALAGSLAVISAGGIAHAFHRAQPRTTDAGAAGTSGAGGTSNSGGSGNASGNAGADGGSAAAGGTSGASGVSGTGSNAQTRPSEEDSGCGCRVASGDDSRPVGWVAMLVALVLRGRRRR